jgi:leucyl-tRNA synthetase
MEVFRWAGRAKAAMSDDEWERTSRTLVRLLAPLAPHLAEELWAHLGGESSVHTQPWPTFDPSALERNEITIVVEVDGRVRDRLTVPPGLGRDEILARALASERVRRHLDGRSPRDVVFVLDRVINLLS